MKSIKLILPIAAFVFAFGGVFASKNLLDVPAKYKSSTQCLDSTADSDCLTSNTGTVCTVTGVGSGDAWNSDCTLRLKHPVE